MRVYVSVPWVSLVDGAPPGWLPHGACARQSVGGMVHAKLKGGTVTTPFITPTQKHSEAQKHKKTVNKKSKTWAERQQKVHEEFDGVYVT